MMNNLFSMFDPISNNMMSCKWSLMIIMLTLWIPKFFLKSSKTQMMWNIFIKKLNNEIYSILKKTPEGSIILTNVIFIMVFLMNWFGVMPYCYSLTSSMMITLSTILPIWFSITIIWSLKKSIEFMSHLIPTGTPMVMIMFMVLVETISYLIRPVTLAIRLMANMVAGHILLSLIGSYTANTILSKVTSSMVCHMLLSTMELFVVVIQAYVMTMLISLYMNELK